MKVILKMVLEQVKVYLKQKMVKDILEILKRIFIYNINKIS